MADLRPKCHKAVDTTSSKTSKLVLGHRPYLYVEMPAPGVCDLVQPVCYKASSIRSVLVVTQLHLLRFVVAGLQLH